MRAALQVPVSDVSDTAPAGILEDAMALTLNEKGVICDSDLSSEGSLGYRPSDLVWQHISMLLPELASIKLMIGKKLNPRLCFLSHIGYRFRVIGQGGMILAGELFIQHMESPKSSYLRAMIRPVPGAHGFGRRL